MYFTCILCICQLFFEGPANLKREMIVNWFQFYFFVLGLSENVVLFFQSKREDCYGYYNFISELIFLFITFYFEVKKLDS